MVGPGDGLEHGRVGAGGVVAGERAAGGRRELHRHQYGCGPAGRDVPAQLGGRAGSLHYCPARCRRWRSRSGSARRAPSSPRPSGGSPQVVLERPQLVGFGTVADLAEAAGAGAATVVRLAAKLGFDGFSALQASVQRDLAHQLRPAAERIREIGGDQPIARHRAAELSNVQATAGRRRPGDARRRRRRCWPTRTGTCSCWPATPSAASPSSSPPISAPCGRRGDGRRQRRRACAGSSPSAVADSTLVVVDLRRYERWVLEAVDQGRGRRGTRSSPCPTACCHRWRWWPTTRSRSSAASVSPFDSHVGTLALVRPARGRGRRTAQGVGSGPAPAGRDGVGGGRDRSSIPDQPGEQGSEVGDGGAREIGDRVPGDGVPLDARAVPSGRR